MYTIQWVSPKVSQVFLHIETLEGRAKTPLLIVSEQNLVYFPLNMSCPEQSIILFTLESPTPSLRSYFPYKHAF